MKFAFLYVNYNFVKNAEHRIVYYFVINVLFKFGH